MSLTATLKILLLIHLCLCLLPLKDYCAFVLMEICTNSGNALQSVKVTTSLTKIYVNVKAEYKIVEVKIIFNRRCCSRAAESSNFS